MQNKQKAASSGNSRLQYGQFFVFKYSPPQGLGTDFLSGEYLTTDFQKFTVLTAQYPINSLCADTVCPDLGVYIF
jgi:hypothetical protein